GGGDCVDADGVTCARVGDATSLRLGTPDGDGDACDCDADGACTTEILCAGAGTPDPDCAPCPDEDGDGVCSAADNCPAVANPGQADSDRAPRLVVFDCVRRHELEPGAAIRIQQGGGDDLAGGPLGGDGVEF